jgi:hypothetical protein
MPDRLRTEYGFDKRSTTKKSVDDDEGLVGE